MKKPVVDATPDSAHRFVEFPERETEGSIAERFERQVSRFANRVALKSPRATLTYDELNQHANRLARAIAGRQQSQDRPVILLLEHDAPAIIGVVGALKAGKSFIPLDPSVPAARCEFVLQDSQADLIVTNEKNLAAATLLQNEPVRIINIDQLDGGLTTANLKIAIEPDQISWILYTSGSTGQPKGVLQTQRNELYNIRQHTNTLRISAQDRLTLLGSYSTGQGMQDIYTALLNGAALYPLNVKAGGLGRLARLLSDEKITIYHSAATLFRHFVYSLSGAENFAALRVLRLGSEQVNWKDVELFKRHFSDRCILVNALSSSECRTLRQFLADKKTMVTGVVPVGQPVDGKTVLLLDDDGNEVAQGEVGEIVVKSRYITPGYWRRPDLTAAAFSTQGCASGERRFRTGDLGRLTSDGNLEHLGRKDFQVKIRGFRVELCEVELALLQIAGIREAVVLPRPDRFGDQRLVAYLAVGERETLTPSGLRARLKAKLPDYMVPAAFVVLESLPLTATGKLDPHSLPEPGSDRPELDVPWVGPRTPVEEGLATIWCDLLGVQALGVDDNFFELGGNSLLALRLLARVSDHFHCQVPFDRFIASPTVAGMAELIVVGGETDADAQPFARVQAWQDRDMPLSFAQERLWFLHQWESANPVYSITRAYRLTGPLDRALLARSLEVIARRHDTLRTTFANIGDQPVQRISQDSLPAIRTIDLRHLPRAERQAEALRWVGDEAGHRFDLAAEPALRLSLFELDTEDHVLVLAAHQIIFDGRSLDIFFRELEALYASGGDGARADLARLTAQYADYALRQRVALKGAALDEDLRYWKTALGGRLPVLALPTDRPRAAQPSLKGMRKKFVIDEALTGALKDLSRRNASTLFVTLMAAFKVLLHRYTAQEDVIVGFPVANRDQTDLENLIGFFVNTLILRSDLSGAPTFRELLARVRVGMQGALTHRELPFERLVVELAPERDLSHSPLFQTMFTFQNRLPAELRLAGVHAESMDCDAGTAKFDLTLALGERDGRLLGAFEYSSELFDGATIDRLIGHFQTLLKGIVPDPDRSIALLPLLTPAERKRILIEWNDTAANYPKNRCVHELFEAQVKKTPNAVAVECAGQWLTYLELNRRANRLARYLRQRGLGPDKLAAVCVPRSLEMIVSLLAVFKAGGAYLPLDPCYPRERLRFMLQDSQACILLADSRFIEYGNCQRQDGESQSAILDPPMETVSIDQARHDIARQSGKNLRRSTTANNLAYVIYTSGSTGLPKGVAVEQKNVVAFLHWAKGLFSRAELAGVLASTSICFDLSVFEMFTPLCWGGKMIVVDDALALHGMAAPERVTLINTVPSALAELLALGPLPASIKTVNFAGEPLKQDLVRKVYEGGTVLNVYDLYGPSETTIYSTYTLRRRDGPATIGRPIANTQVYLLDGARQPVPIGVTGEIYIGGAGVARGYLNRPELSAERFVADPFGITRAGRLYRTGDLARYRPDGTIEYLGRADDQVKIRGHRIELGEIETMLNRYSAIRECAVVARETGLTDIADSKLQITDSHKELIAFFVPNGAAAPMDAELRSFLRQCLPEFMVPSWFVALESLPLTPNGKVDRKALPAPTGRRPRLAREFVSPRGEIEELVTQTWREVLRLDEVGVHDNFFDLGGHSLLATRVAARLRVSFDLELPLRKLFELPTVAAFSAYVEELRGAQRGACGAPILPVARRGDLPLSSAQRRLWFLQQLDPASSAYNIPAAYRVHGPLDVSALVAALDEIVARHESLRTAIVDLNGQPVQRILPQAALSVPLVDLTQLAVDRVDAEVARLTNEAAHQPYDLSHAPLMRAQLLLLGAADHVLVLNFHHIVADASSLADFYRELAIFYGAISVRKTTGLPALPVQFADYASWQQEWLLSQAADAQLTYWRRQLDGLAPLDLPADFDRPARQSYRGSRIARRLPADLTGALKQLARREGATLFMTLLAAFDILLARLSGRDDIVVGSTIAGRNRPELEGVIGFFINALALRCDLSGRPSFTELLKRVRETCLDGYTHQDLPFDKIVEALNPERDFSRNPLFQVMFNLNEIGARSLKLKDCRTEKIAQAEPAAKFDIILYAPEINGAIELTMVYNAELFTEARMAQCLEQLSTILAQAAAAPDQAIDRYSLSTPSARTSLPDPAAPLGDRWQGAVQQFASHHARSAAERLAIADAGGNWTYRELDEQSSRLANLLARSGVEPHDVVAIYAQRRAALVLALLGALKAGAVFVILDPAYPPARLCDYLRIARPKGWLQLDPAGELAEELARFLDNSELCCPIDLPATRHAIAELLGQHAATAPDISFSADDPAYIAFTSGSTGQPKGVLCRHGPMSHFLPWQEEVFALRDTDRYCLLSGLGYNHLQREIFTALASGAALYVPTAAQMRSPGQLVEWLRACEISVLHLTPALGRLLQSAGAAPLASLRRIFFGGDLLTRQDVAAMRGLAPNAKIVCFYGATETQRAVGYYTVEDGAPDGASAILPTGRGAQDVQLILLTASGQLAGVGELGELYVRSPHLAAGYVGDAELTAANFLVNPFTQNPRDRLYRTGELGRYRPDGNVEWVGRSDRQVSIRGFRVELAEVETTLLQHPSVRQAAVVVDNSKFQSSPADQNSRLSEQLIAYVVGDDSARNLAKDLRPFLAAKLPHYMVPAEFVILDRLPLSPNGKVDYFNLPAPSRERAAENPYEEPASPVERQLAEMFSEVLGVARIGRWDDFFQLGGHSLLAAQVSARIRQRFNIGLELRSFLEAPSVAALARRLESLGSSSLGSTPGPTQDREEIEL